jgi:LysR family transcriptional regulator, glycine cleavage system transcriptional activator
MARSLPPLNALRVFDAAARAQSFTDAARELHVSQGAVSRHVAQLEEFLGVSLFDREHRKVSLTPAGAAYARAIGGGFDQIEQATREIKEARERLPIRIRLFPSVAIKWLISRMAEFHALHPAIEVRIMTIQSRVRFDPREDDFTIQIGNVAQPGVHYDPLIPIELLPVCAPSCLARMPVAAPEDLFAQNLLCSVQRPQDWARWFAHAGIGTAEIARRMRLSMKFGTSALAYQAAIDGMGVVMAQRELVRDDLASGRLVPAHSLALSLDDTYYLASDAVAHRRSDIQMFRHWILSRSGRLEAVVPAQTRSSRLQS